MGAEIGRIISLFNVQTEKSHVRISLSLKEPITIRVDCDKMRQVFINLMLNAIQAMGNGGKLEITIRRAGNDGVEILFVDSGPGIPPDLINSVFKPFFTTRKDGSGLGLAIAKRIVEEHKGKILVQSMPGKGTIFTVRLPWGQ